MNNEKQTSMSVGVKITIAVLITFIATALLMGVIFATVQQNTGLRGGSYYYAVPSNSEDEGAPREEFENFNAVMDGIARYYSRDIDWDEVERGAINGALAYLGDDYASWYDEDNAATLFEDFDGEYVGLGIEVLNDTSTNRILVLGVYEGSPAFEAGIEPGDYLIAADGTPYRGDELNDAVSYMRGEHLASPVGTTVKITVLRGEEELELEITRGVIKQSPVSFEYYGNTLYIKYTGFDETATAEFKRIIDERKPDCDGVIIDIRNNPGGDTDCAAEMSEIFLDEGDVIMSIVDKSGEGEVYTAEGKALGLPTVVIVNENSASSSEIFAGALKVNKAAAIVGQTTYGKGVSQGFYPYYGGFDMRGVLKITAYDNLLPDGSSIDHAGVVPDVVIEHSEDEDEDADAELEAALEIIKSQGDKE